MSRRVSGFLAWGALALLIGIPGSEVLLRSNSSDANPERAGVTEPVLGVEPQITSDTEVRRKIAATETYGPSVLMPPKSDTGVVVGEDKQVAAHAEPVGEPVDATKMRTLGQPVATDRVAELGKSRVLGSPVSQKPAEGQPSVDSQVADGYSDLPDSVVNAPIELGEIADLTNAEIEIPPIPAPRIDRSRIVVASNSTSSESSAGFRSDWSRQRSSGSVELEPYSPGAFQRFADRRDVWRQQELRRPLPPGVIPGSTDYMPPRRGTAVRLDLAN